jgi:hypothetical protein
MCNTSIAAAGELPRGRRIAVGKDGIGLKYLVLIFGCGASLALSGSTGRLPRVQCIFVIDLLR